MQKVALPEGIDIFYRCRWSEYPGLPFSSGYMRILDCHGAGPEKEYVKGRVCYRREHLADWLHKRFNAEQ